MHREAREVDGSGVAPRRPEDAGEDQVPGRLALPALELLGQDCGRGDPPGEGGLLDGEVHLEPVGSAEVEIGGAGDGLARELAGEVEPGAVEADLEAHRPQRHPVPGAREERRPAAGLGVVPGASDHQVPGELPGDRQVGQGLQGLHRDVAGAHGEAQRPAVHRVAPHQQAAAGVEVRHHLVELIALAPRQLPADAHPLVVLAEEDPVGGGGVDGGGQGLLHAGEVHHPVEAPPGAEEALRQGVEVLERVDHVLHPAVVAAHLDVHLHRRGLEAHREPVEAVGGAPALAVGLGQGENPVGVVDVGVAHPGVEAVEDQAPHLGVAVDEGAVVDPAEVGLAVELAPEREIGDPVDLREVDMVEVHVHVEVVVEVEGEVAPGDGLGARQADPRPGHVDAPGAEDHRPVDAGRRQGEDGVVVGGRTPVDAAVQDLEALEVHPRVAGEVHRGQGAGDRGVDLQVAPGPAPGLAEGRDQALEGGAPGGGGDGGGKPRRQEDAGPGVRRPADGIGVHLGELDPVPVDRALDPGVAHAEVAHPPVDHLEAPGGVGVGGGAADAPGEGDPPRDLVRVGEMQGLEEPGQGAGGGDGGVEARVAEVPGGALEPHPQVPALGGEGVDPDLGDAGVDLEPRLHRGGEPVAIVMDRDPPGGEPETLHRAVPGGEEGQVPGVDRPPVREDHVHPRPPDGPGEETEGQPRRLAGRRGRGRRGPGRPGRRSDLDHRLGDLEPVEGELAADALELPEPGVDAPGGGGDARFGHHHLDPVEDQLDPQRVDVAAPDGDRAPEAPGAFAHQVVTGEVPGCLGAHEGHGGGHEADHRGEKGDGETTAHRGGPTDPGPRGCGPVF